MAATKTSDRNCLRRKGLSGFLVRHGRKGMEEWWTWKCEIEAQEKGQNSLSSVKALLPACHYLLPAARPTSCQLQDLPKRCGRLRNNPSNHRV